MFLYVSIQVLINVNRTIELIVGLMITLVASAIFFSLIQNTLFSYDIHPEFDKFISGNYLIFTWVTDQPMTGWVEYGVSPVFFEAREDRYDKIHRVEADISSFPSGTTLNYNVTSCDIDGDCLRTENFLYTIP